MSKYMSGFVPMCACTNNDLGGGDENCWVRKVERKKWEKLRNLNCT